MAWATDRNQGMQPVRTRVSLAAGVTAYSARLQNPCENFLRSFKGGQPWRYRR